MSDREQIGPSPEARAALERSQRDVERTGIIMSEADAVFGEFRGYEAVNHFALRVKLAIRGTAA